ncbi:MAG: YdeI/OmpD-associated family protein [Paracoccaceae bacterium]
MSDPIPFATPADWSQWLTSHPDAKEVWLLIHRKGSGVQSIDWEQAVIEALAHGWIDGVKKSLNETQWMQRFTPRKPGSAWSQKNITHAEKLIAEGRMTPAGLAQVAAARANGRWETAYSGGKNADLPDDFLDAVAADPKAQEALKILDTKNRYAIYYRLTTAKRPETRAKKIAEYVAMLARGERLY